MIGHVNRTQTELKEDTDMCEHNETQVNEELKQKALEHDISDMPEMNVEEGLNSAYHAIEQAVEYGVKVFGATIHYVDESLDGGRIIAQRAIDYDGNDVEEITQLIHSIEHKLYIETINKILK